MHKHIQFAIVYDKEKQKLLTFPTLELDNVGIWLLLTTSVFQLYLS